MARHADAEAVGEGHAAEDRGQEGNLDEVVRFVKGLAGVYAGFVDIEGVHVRLEPAREHELCQAVRGRRID